ncbi:MAG: hypothetical protein CMG14_04210 [Candidatus Marinimicrobia bacterium]|nr:hypothetical protein [Candidatus Neomarinimicrobiota bacterium]|tara:strand:- start:11459 stop:11944 length:486 start_codon:yes stop_codon:yes gene_type:complete
MINNFKQSIPSFFLVLGYLVYFILLFKTSFSISVIWMMILIYLWLSTSLYFNIYNANSFIKILSCSGIFVALSMFFLNGVEEVPFPEGAVVFHAEGIAQALFLLFLCSIPIVLKLIPENTIILNNSIDTKSNSRDIKGKNQSEDWEEATIEDLESGEFETL